MRIRSSRVAENATTPKDVTGRKCVLPEAKAALTVGLYQSRDGGSEVGFRGIPEFNDQRMPFQRLLHDAALHALAASVDQSHLAEAGFLRGVDVLLDDRRNIAGRESVEVDVRFDRYPVWHGGCRSRHTETPRHRDFFRWHARCLSASVCRRGHDGGFPSSGKGTTP